MLIEYRRDPKGSQSSSGSAIASGAQQLPEDSAISLHRFNELAQQLGKSVNFHCQEVMEVTWHAECFGELIASV